MNKSKMSAKSDVVKSAVFTWNNYSPENVEMLRGLEGVTRMVVGAEVSESGTPHLQGAITFKKACRFNTLCKILKGAHVEKAAEINAAMNYCMKENIVININNSEQGKRTDLEKVYECAEAGMKYRDFLRNMKPSVNQISLFVKARDGLKEDRPILVGENALKIIWLYGDTGTGKSRIAYESGAFRIPTFKWFDGYEYEDICWIDEMRPGWCKFEEMLQLTDIYPFQKEVKYGMMRVQFKTLYITSHFSPKEMWNTHEDLSQLMRRITELKYFRKTPLGVTVTEVREGNSSFSGLRPPYPYHELEFYDEL